MSRKLFNIFQKQHFDEWIRWFDEQTYYPFIISFDNNEIINILFVSHVGIYHSPISPAFLSDSVTYQQCGNCSRYWMCEYDAWMLLLQSKHIQRLVHSWKVLSRSTYNWCSRQLISIYHSTKTFISHPHRLNHSDMVRINLGISEIYKFWWFFLHTGVFFIICSNIYIEELKIQHTTPNGDIK